MTEAAIYKRIKFDAAHLIPNHPGKCRNLHGHTYIVEVGVQGPVNAETGMVKDFYEIKTDLLVVIDRPCDHKFLNDVYPDMLTTAENLAALWLRQLIKLDSRYCMVRVFETPDSWAEVRAGDLV